MNLDTSNIREILDAADGVTTEIESVGGGVEWLIVTYRGVETFTGPHFWEDHKIVCDTSDLFAWRYDGDAELPLWQCQAGTTARGVAEAILGMLD